MCYALLYLVFTKFDSDFDLFLETHLAVYSSVGQGSSNYRDTKGGVPNYCKEIQDLATIIIFSQKFSQRVI